MQRNETARVSTRGPGASGSPADTSQAADVNAAGETLKVDICVIGAGSGGLSVAAAAAAFGRSVVLIEKHKMGGDCLNFGCVPSKALLASAKRAHAMRTSGEFGVVSVEPQIDHRAVHQHVRSVISAIAPNDSVERFSGLGVRVILGAARFADKRTVIAGDYRITARRFVVATGSSPLVPPILGLDKAPYFTNETIFDNDKKLAHLVIIGGGPIGLEMAQAHRRLGSRVTVIEGARALGKDDPELSAVVLKKLRAEGIDILEGTSATQVDATPGSVRIHVKSENGTLSMVDGTHLLVAAGRRPNVGDLNLEAAGIKYDRRGISVGKSLRTSNSRVYAIGDVTGGLQFTHVASRHAEIVIRRALFWLPAKANDDIVPWVTFTDPELAHVGISEAEATKRKIPVNVLRWPYHENDRAQTERETDGHIKIVTDRKGRILGASIVGAHAGELIQMWSLAISQKLKIGAMTGWISPYPTLGEISKRAAIRNYATLPAQPIVRKIVNLLAKLG
jgi:pyruvate/2-oxoglutarate dehydrogenase complex dihydrolipoamide dehydrogenase (E3) component